MTVKENSEGRAMPAINAHEKIVRLEKAMNPRPLPHNPPEAEAIIFHQYGKGPYMCEAVKRRLAAEIITTNNFFDTTDDIVATFCGMVDAMKVCKETGRRNPIYTDIQIIPFLIASDSTVEHFKNQPLSEPDRLILDKAITWLAKNPDHIECRFWDVSVYGTISYYFHGEDITPPKK
jgi:hypothetical protein